MKPKTKKPVLQAVPHKLTVPSKSESQLFKGYLKACSKHYDYNQEEGNQTEKQIQIRAISKLRSMVGNPRHFASVIYPHFPTLFEMILSKILRPLPSSHKQQQIQVADTGVLEETESDRNWTFLKQIYSLYLQLIENPAVQPGLLKSWISASFLTKYFDIFNSENQEEREMLKTILHKMYAKCVMRRKLIRRAFSHCFYELIYEKAHFSGINEILEINAAIIAGFAVPLRQEHVHFFKTIIVPLLKVQSYDSFFNEHLRCAMLFISKQASLAPVLLEGLLKYWPFGNLNKQLCFLNIVFELQDHLNFEENPTLLTKLFQRIKKCLGSEHMRVVDTTMCLFQNQKFIDSVKSNVLVVFPLIVPTVEKQCSNFWLKIIKEAFNQLRIILQDIDSSQYSKALISPKEAAEEGSRARYLLDKHWDALEKAVHKQSGFNAECEVPYSKEQVPAKYNETYSLVGVKDQFY